MNSETAVWTTNEMAWNIGYCDLVMKIIDDTGKKLLEFQDFILKRSVTVFLKTKKDTQVLKPMSLFSCLPCKAIWC